MALLRMQEVSKMSAEERTQKLKGLRLELVKANVTAHKATAKTKEIKRAIARISTVAKSKVQEVSTRNG